MYKRSTVAHVSLGDAWDYSVFLNATRMASRTPAVLQFLKNQKPQKLFRVLNKIEGYGVGRRVTRVIWKQEERSPNLPISYWTVTKVIPHKELRTGKVWGVLTWKGTSEARERRVRSPLKKHWKLLPK